MRTTEIPREQWASRLTEFTVVHDGWLVSLDVFGGELGAQHEIVNLPLIGVAAERSGSEDRVAISVARAPGEHFTHVVHGVTRIWLQSENAADAAIELESSDGLRTVLRLRVAALPETVDGIVRG